MNPLEWAVTLIGLWVISGLIVCAFFACSSDDPEWPSPRGESEIEKHWREWR